MSVGEWKKTEWGEGGGGGEGEREGVKLHKISLYLTKIKKAKRKILSLVT